VTDSNVVAVLVDLPGGAILCSGSLIAPNLVLTAQHCVAHGSKTVSSCASYTFGAMDDASSIVVSSSHDAAAALFDGSSTSFPNADGMTWFGVHSVAVPGGDICGEDLAAITLSTNITGVCPLIPSVDTDVAVGEPYTAIGFGTTTPTGSVAGVRYSVGHLNVVCAENCNDPAMSATREWLGGTSAAAGACEGDSGGPAIDSLGRVIGGTSRGPSSVCNRTVYESYFGQGAWIKQVAAVAAQAGGYSAAGWVTGGATSDPANGYCSSSGFSDPSSGGSSGGGCAVGGGLRDRACGGGFLLAGLLLVLRARRRAA
jgi:hypothetical protein